MNSSMLAGERRWASARRGGMTVLGKVSVPKPLNLPSQRLENHGLDPNVEIVPKGTVCWGSRPSSSGSNAWVSSTSNVDCGITSPSHLSGRPSSAGSGTRPSTAGSDRTYEPANAWVSNSRPSSSSGTLTSSQTSLTSLRPRSAETRPNSSQLSRFAEPVPEGSVPLGTSSTAERLGTKSFKEEEFALSSVDFPTLGSEKETPAVNVELQDHDRPSLSSGRLVQAKEDTLFHSESPCGITDNFRTEDGMYSKMEKWRGEPQQYFSTKSPQNLDAWRGPPVNPPPGPWYRGYSGRPAFGSPVAPGVFPMEPFPYYQPQIPPLTIGGPQAVLPAGPGPRRPPPKNGGLYRPQAADVYASPGMQFRPAFYHGPPGPPGGPMNFEGYYGPPNSYYNNEREFTFASMSAGPAFYHGYPPAGAPDLVSSHGRASGHGSGGKMLSEPVEADHKGHLKVCAMNCNRREWKGEGENWEQDVQSNVLYPGKNNLPIMTSQKDEWGAEEDADAPKFSKRKLPSDGSANNIEYQGHSSEFVRMKSFENMGSVGEANDNWTNTSPRATSFSPEMPQPPLPSERKLSVPTATNIVGLNARAGVIDGQYDATVTCKEWRSRPEVEMNNAVSFERALVSQDLTSVPHQAVKPVQNKKTNPARLLSSTYHGAQDKVDHYGKGKFNSKDADVCAMIPPAPELSGVKISSAVESDSHRAKMKEMVKQRARQLEKEEEERTREQKAKAFAKLAELNRRTQVGESVDQKFETARFFCDNEQEKEEACAQVESVLVDQKSHTHCQKVNFDHNASLLERGDTNPRSAESVEEFRSCSFERSQTGQSESSRLFEQSSSMKEDDHSASARKVAAQLNDKGIFRHDGESYKQKQNNSLLKGLNERSVANVACVTQKDLLNIGSNVISIEAASSQIKASGLSHAPNISDTGGIKPSMQQARKGNNSKNKQKPDESQFFPASSPVPSYSDMGKGTIENAESNVYFPNLGGSVLAVADPDRGIQATAEVSSLPPEEAQSRSTNSYKHHPSRRMPRNHQSNKVMDKSHGNDTVIWAPVRMQNKADCATEVDRKLSLETTLNTNSDNTAPNISKGKRAEMERYVPKPVAKELAQQESIPTVQFSTNSSTSDETFGKGKSGSIGSSSLQHVSAVTPLVGSIPEIKEADGKHNKHKREQGTWRQRGSSHMKGVHLESPRISEPTDDDHKFTEHKSMKSVKTSPNAEISSPRSIDTSACVITSNDTTMGKTRIKDEGAGVFGNHPSRDPQHLSKVPQSTGKYDGGGISGEADGRSTMSAISDTGVAEKTTASKDNHSLGERPSPHWQPKSNSRSANSLHVSKTAGIEIVTVEVTKAPKQDHKVQVPLQGEKKSRNTYKPRTSQSFCEGEVGREPTVGQHQEINREKKTLRAKEVSHVPNQDSITSTESASIYTYVQQEHNAPSGSGTTGKQNNRSFRSHESQGDMSSGQNSRPTNMARERHRQNSQYEYRPYKNNKSENLDQQTDGINPSRAYSGRGGNHTKHG